MHLKYRNMRLKDEAEAEVVDISMLRMREATIVAGIWMTFGVGGLGMLYVLLTWQRPHRLELSVLFVFATAAGILVAMLPRERVVRSRLREPFFLCWTMLDLVMLMVGTLADGGTASPLVLVFFVPVVFSSMSYPLGSVATVGIVSVLSYLALALVAGGSSPAFEVAFAAALVCTAAMSAWQAQNHNRQHRALARVSRTDPLTGCLNRRGFEERAAAEIGAMNRRERCGAILVLDIDHFKPVNDTYGHAAGDELLCWVAGTLERTVRAADAVGRLGGDEFAVLLPEIDAEHARERATRIEQALAERAPASLGLAVFPDDGSSLQDLTRRADMRLYASRRGRAVGAGGPPAAGAAQAGASGSTPGAAVGEGSHGPLNLWRAALEAMPSRATGGHRASEQDSLQAALLDQIDASVVVTDMSGAVISWNSGAEALYGWSAEEAVGRGAGELIVPEDQEAAKRLLIELRRDGRWDGELLVRRKDGSTFTAYVRNRLAFDEAGDPAAVVGVAVDVSERTRQDEQNRRDAETLACIDRVQAALAEERFVLYAQPIADVRTGETVQHELLVRMREPDGRIAAPGEFLPVAEQYALIGEIDLWVIEQATRLAGSGCAVELNVSARSVGDPEVLERIERCIEQHEVAPGMLVFEITETAILEDEEAARAFAERLHALGCKVALDDFGTGYGSFTYLKQIPVDYLKLDVEFVRDLISNSASRHVVQAVVALARDFHLQTVAEGVEDAATLELLGSLGVDFAQGYHIARPEPFAQRPGDRSASSSIRARALRSLEAQPFLRTPPAGSPAPSRPTAQRR
jgi:diguanylate cyclase (GGDEF)-like protein/PAS domain S-box-containing protein